MKIESKETLTITRNQGGEYAMTYTPTSRYNNSSLFNLRLVNAISKEECSLGETVLFEDKGRVMMVPPKYRNARKFEENYELQNWIFKDDAKFTAKMKIAENAATLDTYKENVSNYSKTTVNRANNAKPSGINIPKASNGFRANSAHPANFSSNTEYVPKAHMDSVVKAVKSRYNKLIDDLDRDLDNLSQELINVRYEIKKRIEKEKDQ